MDLFDDGPSDAPSAAAGLVDPQRNVLGGRNCGATCRTRTGSAACHRPQGTS